MCRLLSLRLSLVLFAFALVRPVQGAEPADDEFFEAKVRPILVARCGECHGATAKIKGGLRLTSRAAVLKGGETGPAAVSGKSEESALVAAIRYVDEPRMPPKGKLSDTEIAVLTRWVDRGLHWPAETATTPVLAIATPSWKITDDQRKHWSFQPLRNPPSPSTKDATWARSDVDRFLLAGLGRGGLKPAPPADRRTLIRRATFDLTGLPPTPEDVEAFVSDSTPDAFRKVVDRLLASPRYGERWGRHWLDLVRYADSRDARGVGSADDITEAYRYRDWVVNAFNRDLPYDRFVIDQIAGDLLPASTSGGFNADGMVATGLLTIGEWGTGDADKEKMMTDIVADQIDVVGRAFMGLTIACARCHDHKFDPISHADYYALAGIFFSTHILPEPGAKTAGSPMLRTPIVPRSTIEAVEAYQGKLARLEAEQKSAIEGETRAFATAQLSRTADYLRAVGDVAKSGDTTAPIEPIAKGRNLEPATLGRWLNYVGMRNEGTLLSQPRTAMSGIAGVDYWTIGNGIPWVGINRNNEPVLILTFVLPPRSVDLHPGPNEPAAVVWTSPIAADVSVSGRVIDSDSTCGNGVSWSVEHRHGMAWKSVASGQIENGGKAEIKALKRTVAIGDAFRLVVAPKGEYSCDTTTIELKIMADNGPSWDLTADLLPDILLGDKGNPHPDRERRPDVWRFVMLDAANTPRRDDPTSPLSVWFKTIDLGDRAAINAASESVQKSLTSAAGKGFSEELTSPRGPFSPGLADLPSDVRARLAKRQAEIDAMRASPLPPIPLGLVAQEGGVPKSVYEGVKDARIQIRGDYARLGPVVPRRFPTILVGSEAVPKLIGSGRLELARWIARPDHPLTARVMANRIWEFHFGEGIVRTPSNFGKLGEPPSDPDLLDHLASRFIASGWSIKAMHRLIMNSAAYQQSSAIPLSSAKADPENRLFGRMNRRRLESEPLRDSLLAISGRLDPTMGGPSYRDFDVPRRTLYLMTIRSDRSSFGPLFDAADATAVVDKRVVSTVAPQALFLLNNGFVLTSARAFADRIIREANTTDARIDRAYHLAFGRSPTTDEVEIGRGLVGTANDPKGWTAYLHVLLCGNEFLFVD